MPAFKAIFFDLDNTLLDFLRLKKESCQAVVDSVLEAGLKMDRAEAIRLLIKTYLECGLDSKDAFTKFLKGCGQYNRKLLDAAKKAYLAAKPTFLVPYPKVKATLGELKDRGLVLAVVTDAPEGKPLDWLRALGLEACFEFVVGLKDSRRRKETGLPFMFALRKLREKHGDIGVPEVLVVGDSVVRDILPAQKLGFKTALAKYGQVDNKSVNADYELLDFSDLAGIC
jgi:putative hydrolase of the HAD superfamily